MAASMQRCREKVECDGQLLQTFRYPRCHNRFCPSPLSLRIRAHKLFHSNHSKAWRTKKTNQTNAPYFRPHGGARGPSPTKVGTMIEEICTILAPLKREIWHGGFDLRDEKLQNRPLSNRNTGALRCAQCWRYATRLLPENVRVRTLPIHEEFMVAILCTIFIMILHALSH